VGHRLGCCAERLQAKQLAEQRLMLLVSRSRPIPRPAGKKAAKGKKKKAGLPPLVPEQEELLTAAACCLRHLTAGSACDAARVALAGGAEPLVALLDSGRLQLRQAAKVRVVRMARRLLRWASAPSRTCS
jgi:hypothetical protein